MCDEDLPLKFSLSLLTLTEHPRGSDRGLERGPGGGFPGLLREIRNPESDHHPMPESSPDG